MKHALNKLIDEMVHQGKPSKDVGTILIDELLHACVEGEFKPEKFVRYSLLPLLRKPRKRRRGKG